MNSKFTYWAYLPIIILPSSALFLYVLFKIFEQNPPYTFYILLIAILLFNYWFVMLELRKKIISIKINELGIKAINFIGLGFQSAISFNEVAGYKISVPPKELGVYEILYLISNEKKVIRISEFYHGNYYDLKLFFMSKFKSLGEEDFSICH